MPLPRTVPWAPEPYVPARMSTRQAIPAAARREPASPALRASTSPMSVRSRRRLSRSSSLLASSSRSSVSRASRSASARRCARPRPAHRGPGRAVMPVRALRGAPPAACAARGWRRRRRRAAWPGHAAAEQTARSSCPSARQPRPSSAGPRPVTPRHGLRSRRLPPEPLDRGQGGARQPVGAKARDGDEDGAADRKLPRDLALNGLVRRQAAGLRMPRPAVPCGLEGGTPKWLRPNAPRWGDDVPWSAVQSGCQRDRAGVCRWMSGCI